MKRFLILALCFLMLLPLGCVRPEGNVTPDGTASPASDTETAPTASAEEDGYCFDYRFTTWGAIMNPGANCIVETDDCIYYLSNGTLWFSDREYKDFMPLCAKPNCDHNNPECDAKLFFDEDIHGIWVYGSYIYYIDTNLAPGEEADITHPSLCRMRLDGSQHEEVMRLPEIEVDYTPEYNTWGYVFSNKYLWVTNSAWRQSAAMGGMPDSASFLIRLDTLKAEPREAVGIGWPIYGIGERIYGFGNRYGENGERISAFSEYNFETGEKRIIGDAEGWVYMLEAGYGVSGNEVLYQTLDQETGELTVWGMDIDAGENRQILTGNTSDIKWVNYDWTTGCYFKDYRGGRDGGEQMRPDWGFWMTDLSGNETLVLPYDDYPEDFGDSMIFLQTDSYIFAAPSLDPDRPGYSAAFTVPTWYLDKTELGTDSFGWHKWAPED